MLGIKAATNNEIIETWIYTVNTEATTSGAKISAIPFSLDTYPTNKQQLTVDWGDGNIETLTPEDYTPTDPSASIHEYDEAGIYQIKVSSPVFSSITIDATNSLNITNPICIHLKYFRETLISVQNPFPRLIGENVFRADDTEKLKGNTYYDNERYDNVYGDVKTFVTTEAPLRQTMTIITAGTYGWVTYNNMSYSNCLKSNNMGVASSTARSILSFTVNQATDLTFGYKVSSESGYDKMTIKVDNSTICNGISGSTYQSSNTVSLAKGDHTITLEYTKNDSGNSNQDCGYIYNIAVNGELLSNDDFK